MKTLSLVCTSALLWATLSHAAEKDLPHLTITPEQYQAMGVEIAAIQTLKPTDGMEVMAKVTLPPASVRVVAAPATGLVTALLHQAGDKIAAGDKLATLASPDAVEAQRQYIQAQLKHQLATDHAAREQPLVAQGLIARNTWLQTENEVKLAQADKDAAAATLRLLGVKPDSNAHDITLTAPINGWVLETLVETGQRVEAPNPLIKIANLRRLSLDIPLTPTQAQAVRIGQTLRIEGNDSKVRVQAIQPALDAAQNVIVRADLEQTAITLHLGQSVKVQWQSESVTATSPTIPTDSVIWQGDKAYVFVQTDDGFVPTPITVLQHAGQQTSISGLATDSRIAVKGVAALKAKWLEGAEAGG